MMSHTRESAVEAAAMEIYTASAAPIADARALYARDHLLRGEMDAAADIVMPALVKGIASPHMQRVAAALYHMATVKKGRGRRSLARPPKWMEIGSRYEALHAEQGLTWAEAVEQLMTEFRRGKTSIEDAVRFFLDVQKKVGDLTDHQHPLSPR